MMKLINADALTAPLKEEYKKVKQAFDETSVFQAPNDVALYGALMQEVGAVIGMIEDAPTIEAEPVRHGKWIKTREFHGMYDEFPRRAYACSECHVAFPTDDYVVEDFRYCPNCGCRMDKE